MMFSKYEYVLICIILGNYYESRMEIEVPKFIIQSCHEEIKPQSQGPYLLQHAMNLHTNKTT